MGRVFHVGAPDGLALGEVLQVVPADRVDVARRRRDRREEPHGLHRGAVARGRGAADGVERRGTGLDQRHHPGRIEARQGGAGQVDDAPVRAHGAEAGGAPGIGQEGDEAQRVAARGRDRAARTGGGRQRGGRPRQRTGRRHGSGHGRGEVQEITPGAHGSSSSAPAARRGGAPGELRIHAFKMQTPCANGGAAPRPRGPGLGHPAPRPATVPSTRIDRLSDDPQSEGCGARALPPAEPTHRPPEGETPAWMRRPTRSTRSSTRITTARRGENFIGGDIHDGPMPIDYFVWVMSGGGRTIVVDTGFDRAMAAKRRPRRSCLPVEEGLARSASTRTRVETSS